MGFIPNAQSQTLSGKLLVDALRRGGYVIVMRHASSPCDTPDARTAHADNVDRERQLDDAGRLSAAAFGRGVRC